MGELTGEQQFNAGSSVLAKVLKLDVPPIFFRDNKEQTLSQHGEHLPLLIGRHRGRVVRRRNRDGRYHGPRHADRADHCGGGRGRES